MCIHHFRSQFLLYLSPCVCASAPSPSSLFLLFVSSFDNSNHGNGLPQMPFATTRKINKTNRSHLKIVGLRIFAINYSIFGWCSVRTYALLLPLLLLFLHIASQNGFPIAAADAILNFCVPLIFLFLSVLVLPFARVCM